MALQVTHSQHCALRFLTENNDGQTSGIIADTNDQNAWKTTEYLTTT